jgi:hypothetical protein
MLSMTHRRPGKEQHPGSASSPLRPTDLICGTSPRGMLGRSHIGLPRLFNCRPPPPMEPITCSQSSPRFPSKKQPERVVFPAIGATHLLHSTPQAGCFRQLVPPTFCFRRQSGKRGQPGHLVLWVLWFDRWQSLVYFVTSLFLPCFQPEERG